MAQSDSTKLAIYSKGFKGVPDGWRKLCRCNFIVGENSTGKSSFLELIQLIASPQHNLFFKVLGVVPELDSPFDVLSRLTGAKDLTIGYFSRETALDDSLEQSIEANGRLAIYNQYNDELLLQKLLVSIGNTILLFKRDENGINIFKRNVVYEQDNSNLQNAEKFAGYLKNIRGKPDKTWKFDWRRSKDHGVTWNSALFSTFSELLPEFDEAQFFLSLPINGLHHGPIRSKTRRMYHETGVEFSSTGEHYPQLLRRSSKDERKKIDILVNQFGKDSGLFNDVSVVSVKTRVGDKPFAVVIEQSGKHFYVDELGFGVGQILPIITDLAFSPKRHVYLIEQPELHLHPRAQSTLGALFYATCNEGRRLIIETHSDYVLDRFRMECARENINFSAQIIYFDKNVDNTNRATEIEIQSDGRLGELPDGYREFFLREELGKFELL